MPYPVTLKPISSADHDFLYGVFCSTREDLFQSLDLPDEQVEQLKQIQFAAQRSTYRSQYPDADFDLILIDGKRAGNFYAQRGPDRFVLIDIALLPDRRNRGIGGRLVLDLIAQANAAGKALNAHVRKSNAAWRLWKRLGFRIVGDDGVYYEIEVPARASDAVQQTHREA